MYVVASGRHDLELFSTPFLYTCFGALPADYERAYLIWSVLGLASLVAAIAIMARALRWRTAAFLLFLAFVLLLFRPLTSELAVENVNEVQLLIVAMYFVQPTRGARRPARRRNRFQAERGSRAAAGRRVRPRARTPQASAGDARRRGRRRRGGGRQQRVLPVGNGLDRLVHAARSLSQTVYGRETGNLAPALWLGRYAWVLAIVLTVAAAFVVVRHGAASAELAVSMGLVVYLLSEPLVWIHYLLLAIPLAMILLSTPSMAVKAISGLGLTFLAAASAAFTALGLLSLSIAATLGVADRFVTSSSNPTDVH